MLTALMYAMRHDDITTSLLSANKRPLSTQAANPMSHALRCSPERCSLQSATKAMSQWAHQSLSALGSMPTSFQFQPGACDFSQ